MITFLKKHNLLFPYVSLLQSYSRRWVIYIHLIHFFCDIPLKPARVMSISFPCEHIHLKRYFQHLPLQQQLLYQWIIIYGHVLIVEPLSQLRKKTLQFFSISIFAKAFTLANSILGSSSFPKWGLSTWWDMTTKIFASEIRTQLVE